MRSDRSALSSSADRASAAEHPTADTAAQIELRRRRVVLALLAAIFYLPFLGWGLPHATAPDRVKTWAADEIVPLGPLADLSNMLGEPRADWHVGYPWWHYAVVAVAQAPYLAYLKLTGGLDSPSGVYPFGLDDPVGALKVLTFIGRIVSALMGIGAVLATEAFARELWNARVGFLGALFLIPNELLVVFSRAGNVDTPALFWTMLGLAAYARAIRHGVTPRRLAWLGLWAGLAMGTKDQAVAVFLPLALSLLLPRTLASAGFAAGVRAALAGLLASLLAYLWATGMLIRPARHLAHVHALFAEPHKVTAADFYWPRLARDLDGRLELTWRFLWSLGAMATPPLLALAAAGTWIARRTRGRWILWTPALVIFAALIWPSDLVVRRYLLPLMPIITVFAAVAVDAVARRAGGGAGVALACAALAWPVAIAVDLTYSQVKDPRIDVAAWLAQHALPGDRIEYFGHEQKLPRLDADIVSRRIAGRERWDGERGHGPAILEYLVREGPEMVIEIPDWTSQPGQESSGDCPPEVLAALESGAAGYVRVGRWPTRALLHGALARPHLDNPSVAPPVRIWARAGVAKDRGWKLIP
jgi:hypothetical protein